MSQYLPHRDLIIHNDISLYDVLNTSGENDTGYIVECDLTFPKHLHDKFKFYPPAPGITTPNTEWLSDYQKG